MTRSIVAPFGSWRSPITSDLIASATISLRDLVMAGDDIYWSEMRPADGGRVTIVRRAAGGSTADVTAAPFSARTRVHEYGGAAFTVLDGTVVFANDADQRLYRQDPGGAPRPLTPAADLRYADAVLDRRRGRLICVCEDHTAPGREAVNTLVGLDLAAGGPGQVLASGNDFYASPRLSPDGGRLAWLAWNHPNMPWDGCELWVGDIGPGGELANCRLVAGGRQESIFQPEWSPEGLLHLVSDRTGWWNLYRWHEGRCEPLCPRDAEFGLPQWSFGLSTYAFVGQGRIACSFKEQGAWRLALLDTARGSLEPIEVAYSQIQDLRAAPGAVVFKGGSPGEPTSIVRLDLATRRPEVLRRSSDVRIDPGYLSMPQAIEFATTGGRAAHGLFYPPRNRDYTGPQGERPPLLVMSHGGPTSATTTALRLDLQYWTSRGIAVLDVDYGGSTGYGREYRERLKGQWGVVDVADCANGATHLAQVGQVDGDRLAIRGSSAGGFTTLCALTFHTTFRAGASYYGVSDLEALARETHKFESRYLDGLVGPYPGRRDLYWERSPIHHADRLSCPVIFFQGLDDRVVPPDQAEMMVEALHAKGIPVAYLAFAGEQHGFRRAETIRRTLDAELYFYSRVFRFGTADPVEPVEIEHLG